MEIGVGSDKSYPPSGRQFVFASAGRCRLDLRQWEINQINSTISRNTNLCIKFADFGATPAALDKIDGSGITA